MSVKDALKSKLFTLLKEQNLLNDDHKGGCVLFEKRAGIEELLLSFDKAIYRKG